MIYNVTRNLVLGGLAESLGDIGCMARVRHLEQSVANLRLERRRILVVYYDHDPAWGSYKGSEHIWGNDTSFLPVQVWGWRTPPVFLDWLVAHELRHVWQTVAGQFDDPIDTDLRAALSKYSELPVDTPEFNKKYHDAFREEVDADTYADTSVGFAGNIWWGEIIDSAECTPSVASTKLREMTE